VQLTLNGHASVLAEVGEERILVDPFFTDGFASGAVVFHPARDFDLIRLPPISVLVVTHGHLDHFHRPTIERLASEETTLVVPPDATLIAACEGLGFDDLVILEPWERWERGGACIVATPSMFEQEELGLLILEGDKPFYWHMSDTVVQREVGERIRAEFGPVLAVGARYQPGTPLVGYQRSIGISHDERDSQIEWLEAACATEPSLVFPYSWGVAYTGRHRWANRYSAPYSPTEIQRLLAQRLGPDVQSVVGLPGDVIAAGPTQVAHLSQASPYVQHRSGEVDQFEPVDVSTLAGVDSAAEATALASLLEEYFVSMVSPFLHQHLDDPRSPLRDFVNFGIVWQLVVHLGRDDRAAYSMDFRAPRLRLVRGTNPESNYFVHLSGRALLDVLRGDAGAELFWIAADARYYEKVLTASPQTFSAPPVRGWDLFNQIPDPLTLCLRKFGVSAAEPLSR